MPIHDDPVLEERRLDLVRRGMLTPELDSDPRPDTLQTYNDVVNELVTQLRAAGWGRTADLEAKRMEHPVGRKAYSKPRPNSRVRPVPGKRRKR